MKHDDFFKKKIHHLVRLAGRRLPEEVVFAFFFEDVENGAEWQVKRTGDEIIVGPIDETPKDCELRCAFSVLLQILSGNLNPRRAFLDGRLRVNGDIGLALCLQDFIAA